MSEVPRLTEADVRRIVRDELRLIAKQVLDKYGLVIPFEFEDEQMVSAR